MNDHRLYILACLLVMAVGVALRVLPPHDGTGHDLILISVTTLLTHGEWLRNQRRRK